MSVFDEYFYYDEESKSGLRARKDSYCGVPAVVLKRKKDDDCGSIGSHGYYASNYDKNKKCLNHRIIWQMFFGEIPKNHEVDHTDGDRLNNKISNLRCIPRIFNKRNNAIRSNNTSGVTGVDVVHTKNGSKFYRARVKDKNSKEVSKKFSVSNHGDDAAFKMACNARSEMLASLNDRGFGYTNRHGI